MNDLKVGILFDVKTGKLVAGYKDVNNQFRAFDQNSKSATDTVKLLNDQLNKNHTTQTALVAQGKRVATSLSNQRNEATKTALSNKRLGHISTQLGFQLQDMAVQAQAGTSAFVILGQQGSQIASIFGPAGAVFGAVLAIGSAIGGTLFTALSQNEKKIDRVASAYDNLTGSIESLTLAQRQALFSKVTLELGSLNKQAQAARNRVDSLSAALRSPVDRSAEQYKKLTDELNEQKLVLAGLNFEIANHNAKLKTLNPNLKTTTELYAEQRKNVGELLGETFQYAQTVGMSERQLALYQAGLKGANAQELKALNIAFDLIEQKKAQIESDKKATQEQNKLATSARNYAQRLTTKAQNLSKTSESAKLAYELEHGSLQGINAELRTQLELQAQALDAQKAKAERLSELKKLEQQINAPTTATGKENATHSGRINALEGALEETPESEVEQRAKIHALIEQEHQRHTQAIAKIDAQRNSMMLSNGAQLFGSMAGLAKSFAGEQSGIYKAMFAASKAFAMADAIVKIQQGIASAAALPFPANIPAIGSVIAATSSIVSTIGSTNLQGMAHDGIDNVPREGTWLLDRGERVVDSRTNADLKNYLNSNRQSGGGITIHIANQYHASVNKAEMAEFIEQEREIVYSAVVQAKNDRGESF